MFVIVVLVILAIITLLVTLAGPFIVDDINPKKGGMLLGLIPAFFLVVAWLGFSVTQVHAKELGVVTSFGQPVSEVGPGLHMTWPWQEVTKVDETIFSDTYADSTAIPVRLGDGSTATVNATIRWHVDPAAADYIYRNYRSNNPAESLRDSVVDTQFKAAVNQVLSGFNPTANVDLKAGNLNFSPNYLALSDQITASMQGRVKDADGTSLVILDGVTVAGVQYSQPTEDRINAIVAQAAQTQQAIQGESTAKAQAAANNLLAASLNQNPYVLVSKCFDAIATGKFTPPAGFSCWPGSGSAVVLPSGK